MQMVMFDTFNRVKAQSPDASLADAFAAIPRYKSATEKVEVRDANNKLVKLKNGKTKMKSVIIKDEDDNRVIALDTDGDKVISSVTTQVLPRTAKDGKPSLKSVSGLTGQHLFMFEQKAVKALTVAGQAKFNAFISMGGVIKGVQDSASGKMRFTVAPGANGQRMLTDEQLNEQAAARGFKLVADATAKPANNGELDIEVEVENAPEAPAVKSEPAVKPKKQANAKK